MIRRRERESSENIFIASQTSCYSVEIIIRDSAKKSSPEVEQLSDIHIVLEAGPLRTILHATAQDYGANRTTANYHI